MNKKSDRNNELLIELSQIFHKIELEFDWTHKGRNYTDMQEVLFTFAKQNIRTAWGMLEMINDMEEQK